MSFKVSIGGREFDTVSSLRGALQLVARIPITQKQSPAQRQAYIYDCGSMADWHASRLTGRGPKIEFRQLHNEDGSDYGNS